MTASAPLPSWNDGPTRQRILDFVAAVSDRAGASYVPPADRVAVFDNDGTLWCEKPTYTQGFFILARIHELAAQHPELATRQPYQALLSGDREYLAKIGLAGIAQVLLEAHAGLTPEEFTAAAQQFLAGGKHPRFGVPFRDMTYAPMRELLAYLRANEFRVFIVTGGGVEFVRAASEELYGVARDDVIGSAVELTFERHEGRVRLIRTAKLWGSPDEGEPKPINIQAHIGRRPILAAGNSGGDREMLEYAQGGSYPALCLLVDHDDAEREYAYESHSATLAESETILASAARLGWTVVSMKNDWRKVFD
jgi:phosphoserine phosphatase